MAADLVTDFSLRMVCAGMRCATHVVAPGPNSHWLSALVQSAVTDDFRQFAIRGESFETVLGSAAARFDAQATGWGEATRTYGYDPLDQVTVATGGTQSAKGYAYDTNDNRTGSGVVTGAYNRATNDGTYTYQYDMEANRTRRTLTSTA